MTRDRFTAGGIMLAALAVCRVVYAFPPQQYSFYPVCPFYWLTGLLCPGCGATRALHELLHGELIVAAHLNLLLLALLPVILALAGWQAVSLVRSGHFSSMKPANRSVYAVLSVMAAFTMIRNVI